MKQGPCKWASAALLGVVLSSSSAADALLVKGAWPSAGDDSTPVPEAGKIVDSTYANGYFGLKYSLATGWNQRWEGPPPSDSGFYVLAQIEPDDPKQRPIEGHALIAAQDMFFGSTAASSAADLINYSKQHLDPEFKIVRQPYTVRIAHREFIGFEYRSPVSELHWQVMATQIRCHTVEFIFTGRDSQRMARLARELDTLDISDRDAPVCIKDFANSENVIAREEPILPQARFNPVPVRIIIGADGSVAHVHFISAFPEQVRGISDALARWRFKPYLVNGHPVAVETGIMFGLPQIAP
jgi:hypothetical protein